MDDSLKNLGVLGLAVLLVAGVLVSSQFFLDGIQGTGLSTDQGNIDDVDEIGVDTDSGRVTSSVNTRDYRDGDAYWDVDSSPDTYWVKVEHVEADTPEEADEEWIPTTVFLYQNGYGDGFEELSDLSRNDLVDDWRSELSALEGGTTCEMGFTFTTAGRELNVDFEDGSSRTFEYDDDDNGRIDDDDSSYLMADRLRVTDSAVFCGFSSEKVHGHMFDKQVSGLSGRIGFNGDDSGDGSLDYVSIDWRFDSDGDGIIDGNDDCPEEKGVERFSGCPDKAPYISGSSVPADAELGKPFTVSVSASDPEGRGVDVDWSNGASGKSATFVFRESGSQNLSVTVADDRFAGDANVQTVSKSFSVFVRNKREVFVPNGNEKCRSVQLNTGDDRPKDSFKDRSECIEFSDRANSSPEELVRENQDLIFAGVFALSVLIILVLLVYYVYFGRGRRGGNGGR